MHDDDTFRVAVPWTPRVKGRPRMSKYGKVYTPSETRHAEEDFARQFLDAVHDDEWTPWETPVGVELTLRNDLVLVEMWEENDYEQRKLRGDLDNYMKLILDALNGVAFVDDKQIVTLTGRKL